MQTRRSFLTTAVLGGAAFTAGYRLGTGGVASAAREVTLHGFVPADPVAVRGVLEAFLALEGGSLPAPTVDAPPVWRPVVAGALRQAAGRYVRESGEVLDVRMTALDHPLPADVMLQQKARVLDPASGFGRRLLNLRDRLHGHDAEVEVTCRLGARGQALATDRVLVVATESGVQERIALTGADRRLALAGPQGTTEVLVGAGGARVVGASCRHETCRRQGLIARPGELLACAPNRVVLRVATA